MVIDYVHDVHTFILQSVVTQRTYVTQELSEGVHVDFFNCRTNHWQTGHRTNVGRDILVVIFFQMVITSVTSVEHKFWAKATLPVVLAYFSMSLFQMGLVIKNNSYNVYELHGFSEL